MSAIHWNTYIETPYEIIKTDEEIIPEHSRGNLRAFRNNMAYYVARINKEWDCYVELQEFESDAVTSTEATSTDEEFHPVPGALVPDFTKATYRVILCVYEGNTRVFLTDAQRKHLSEVSQKLYNSRPEVIFLDLTRNVVYKSELMSATWINNVIPRLLEAEDRIEDDFVFTSDTHTDFAEIYLAFLHQLKSLYRRGTVAVFSNHPSIKDWQLQESVSFPGLYHPEWSNSLLAPKISNFLISVITGKNEFQIKLINGINPDAEKYPLIRRDDYYGTYSITASNYNDAAIEVRNLYS